MHYESLEHPNVSALWFKRLFRVFCNVTVVIYVFCLRKRKIKVKIHQIKDIVDLNVYSIKFVLNIITEVLVVIYNWIFLCQFVGSLELVQTMFISLARYTNHTNSLELFTVVTENLHRIKSPSSNHPRVESSPSNWIIIVMSSNWVQHHRLNCIICDSSISSLSSNRSV